MTDKELKRLSRIELLEMLVEMSKENEKLQAELEKQAEQHQAEKDELTDQFQSKIAELQSQLDDKNLKISRAGSIAEACLQVNGIFEAAQASAEQYLVNIRNQEQLCQEMERSANANIAEKLAKADVEAQKHIEAAEAKASVLVANAQVQYDRMIAEAQVQSDRMVAEAQAKTSSYWDTVSQRLANFYREHQGLQELLNFRDDKNGQ